MELDAIASAVVGGTSLMGGVGTIPGTLIGFTIIGCCVTVWIWMGYQPLSNKLSSSGFVIIVTVSIWPVKNPNQKIMFDDLIVKLYL